jgi:hypothetical protein
MSKRQKSITTIRIGIWGQKGAGKTTYITILHNELKKDAHFTVKPDPRSGEMDSNMTQIKNGRFPEPTEINIRNNNMEVDIYNYTLTPKNQSHPLFKKEVIIEFIDIGGDFFENLNFGEGNIRFIERNGSQQSNQINDIVGYLNSCQAILFLLDTKNYREPLLSNLFNQLKARCRNNKCPQYIAFCVTKIDRGELWQKTQEKSGVDLVKKVMGNNLFNAIDNYFYFNQKYNFGTSENRCNFYGISSIGRYHQNGSWEEAIETQSDQISTDPETQNSQSNEDDFQSVFDDDLHIESQEFESESQSVNSERIKTGIDLFPINVTAPIKWLIKSIQSN